MKFTTTKAQDTLLLKFLYKTKAGRLLLSLFIRPAFSKSAGWLLSLRISTCLITPFIKKKQIQMDRFEKKEYRSFNDFFKRELQDLPVFNGDKSILCAPCDGKISCFKITNNARFSIKQTTYTLTDLLEDERMAASYADGTVLIFRLTPDDYHHYFFLDDGEMIATKKIPGVLHTVQPIATTTKKVYHQNSREISVLKTKRFGQVVQIEVGALLVGKINNRQNVHAFKTFEKKGCFEFGGSTIIFLFKPNAVTLYPEIWQHSASGTESIVQVNMPIGKKGAGLCD